MRTWDRAWPGEPCGRCGARQAAGAAVVVITLPDLGPAGRRRIRCAACVGHAATPAQLEAAHAARAAAEAEADRARAAVRAGRAAELESEAAEIERRDHKARAAGDRLEAAGAVGARCL